MPARREAKDVLRRARAGAGRGRRLRHMAGVAANLRARLAEECEAEGYDRMTRKDQLPIPPALSLLAREQHVRRAGARGGAARAGPVARHARRAGRRGAGRDEPARTDDQDAFARAARKLLAALDLAEAESRGRTRGPDRGRRGRRRAVRPAGRVRQDGRGQSEAEQDSMLGAQPEDDGRRGRRRRGHRIGGRSAPSPRATTGPAARSRGASVPQPGRRGRLPRLHRGCTTRRSRPRSCAIRRS